MFKWSWIRNLFARPSRPVRKTRVRYRPCIETLEERSQPATFTVTSLANFGPGSLRGAVAAANLNPGHDEIRFAEGLQGTILVTSSGPISITDPLTIIGPDNGKLVVLGSGSRVFTVTPNDVSLTITGLTAQDGRNVPSSWSKPILESVTALDNRTLALQFNHPLGKNAALAESYVIPQLTVEKVQVIESLNRVILTTSPQDARDYNVALNKLRSKSGRIVSVPTNAGKFTGSLRTATSHSTDLAPPRLTGAVSTDNTKVVVSFSKPMSDSALNIANYSIVQAAANGEAAVVLVKDARFLDETRTAVELTTFSQNALNFVVTAVNVKDQAGNSLAPAQLSAGGLMIDPSRAMFFGTGPKGSQIVDTDKDGVTDHVEQRGWQVTIKLANGGTRSWWVTSDPRVADTDGDDLGDAVELQLGSDPRNADTDGDQLTDFQEYNEIFSDHASQDSDGDGLDDGTEFLGLFTSPVHADTDGDGIPDGDEVANPNRNPLVADLPRPSIEIGDVNLTLDVRFTETTSTGTRELQSKSVKSTLSQSENKKYSHTDSNTQEASAKLSASTEFTIDPSLFGFILGGGTEFKTTVGVETGWTGSWTSSTTSESEQATQRAYEDSLQTDAETTAGSTVERTVQGARMQVTVFLKNASTMAFNIRNLQLTAFMYDPSQPTRLVPVATLLPESAPAEGFNLGPLVPERGPFIFANDSIFPSQVEMLMKNPSGLVFRISNFDILDEAGRNFAFASRDVTDRTTSLVIDYGGTDSDGDGEGDLTEYNRVAVSSGRIAIDTNGDGEVDDDDRRIVFDRTGVHVGITLRQALANMRLKEYDESVTPSSSLSEEQLRNSYSIVKDAATGYERIFRIRTVAREAGLAKSWELLTPQGIVRPKTLDDIILSPRSDVKLVFVQDLDGDRLPANLEFLYGTSDQSRDSDGDALDDRFEALIGWRVDLGPNGSRQIFSSPTLADTDGDGLGDFEEAPGTLVRDKDELIIRATRSGPTDIVTDPRNRDTDSDGVSDFDEVRGYTVNLRNPLVPDFTRGRVPDGTSTFFDVVIFSLPFPGFDTGTRVRVSATGGGLTADTDYFIRKVSEAGAHAFYTSQANAFADTNRVDLTATITASVTATFVIGPPTTISVTTNPANPDTDSDSVPDGVERRLGGNPTDPNDRDLFADDDRDGLANIEEIEGWTVTYYQVSTDPLTRGTAVTIHVTSDPFKADTDGDGIPDGEEWRLRLNPRSHDTDGDGLTDFREVRGFQLRDLGVIWTNPLDADTDHDMRSDGDEAELVDIESKRWIVRPVGKTPYRVFSNPLVADADFDGLVDGQEYNWNNGLFRSDPTKANTDSDSRTDGEEWQLGLNPLVEDFLVTVVYRSLQITSDGDAGSNAGEFRWTFDVRLPSNSSVTGLANNTTRVHVFDQLLSILPDYNGDRTRSLAGGFGGVVQIRDDVNNLLDLSRYLPLAQRSITFSVATNQRFALEGEVRELDVNDVVKVNFGGLEGVKATKESGEKVLGVFEGSSLTRGSITELTFSFTSADNFIDRGTTDGGKIAGHVKAMIIVS